MEVCVKYQRPQIVKVDSPTMETVERHPAYGQIGASRVQGHAYLYGSDFNHQHFVTIRISESELNRGLSRDWAFARRELIEVSLSEAQWATFVSAMNVGSGVQCTLNHVMGDSRPGIEAPTVRRSQFQTEFNERLDDAMADLKKARKGIADSGMSQKQKKELIAHLDRAECNLTSNLEFVGNQFSEHMETITEHAKVEVNAYVQSTIVRAGLAAIEANSPFLLPEVSPNDP